jgi:prophage regulatory protein
LSSNGESFAFAVFDSSFVEPSSTKFQGERIMAHKILRLPDVVDRVGFSRSTIYDFVSKGRFPAPVRIGVRAVGWLDTDINDWIDQQVNQSRRPATHRRLSEGGAA